MSIAIAAHVGRFVVIASDGRQGWYAESGAVERAVDGHRKLFRTPVGLIVGTGYCSLLDAVSARMTAEAPATTEEMLAIIAEERAAVDASSLTAPQKERALSTTSWMLTYRAQVNGEMVIRHAVYHERQYGHRFMLSLPGCSLVAVPMPGAGEDAARAELRDSFLPGRLDQRTALCDSESVSRVLDEHLTLFRGIVAESAARLRSISPACQIGVHFEDGETFVSDFIQPAEGMRVAVCA